MTECWTIGFVGNGDVDPENAEGLLDLWMSKTAEIQAVVPARIPAKHKGLHGVVDLMENVFDIPQQSVPAVSIVDHLTKARDEGEEAFLVILGTEDATAVSLAEKALDNGIPVKDLCAALDDVEFEPEPDPEPEPAPAAETRRRGRPRKSPLPAPTERADLPEIVQAEIAGAATIVDHPPFVSHAAELLEQAIRTIIKEELAMFPGVHSRVTDEPEEPRDIRAFVNGDGKYRKAATARSKPRDNEEEVMLTASEAREAGLLD